jgi:hypothetical protein
MFKDTTIIEFFTVHQKVRFKFNFKFLTLKKVLWTIYDD